jgi:hypothetical protein
MKKQNVVFNCQTITLITFFYTLFAVNLYLKINHAMIILRLISKFIEKRLELP